MRHPGYGLRSIPNGFPASTYAMVAANRQQARAAPNTNLCLGELAELQLHIEDQLTQIAFAAKCDVNEVNQCLFTFGMDIKEMYEWACAHRDLPAVWGIRGVWVVGLEPGEESGQDPGVDQA